MRRQFFPRFLKGVEEGVDVLPQLTGLVLVGLGEDDGKWDTLLTKPFNEFEIDFLGLQPRIDEHE